MPPRRRPGLALTQRADRLLQRNWFWYALRRRYRDYASAVPSDREPLLVYQMGKVGSSSVAGTLARHCPEYQVYQIHVLTPEWIRRVEGQYRTASRARHKVTIHEHLLASKWVAEAIARGSHQRPWKVISMVRDPVARNISTFFQAHDIYFSKDSGDRAARRQASDLETLSPSILRERFLNDFGDLRHDMPLNWFQTHLAPVFGLDVYTQPFDICQGYGIYRTSRCDLLILRTEDMQRVLRRAIREFLGIDLPGMETRNVSADKDYAAAFEEFQRDLTLPSSYLDRMYGSRYARHFYSGDELASFRASWERPAASCTLA